jgi:ABC-type polysaccharide/polyol phosphate export permease
MFVTPVIYPLSPLIRCSLDYDDKSLTPLFEYFRLCLLGEGTVSVIYLAASIVFTCFVFSIALVVL